MDLTKAERDATWNLLFSGMSKICDETYPKTTAALISIVQEIRKLNRMPRSSSWATPTCTAHPLLAQLLQQAEQV